MAAAGWWALWRQAFPARLVQYLVRLMANAGRRPENRLRVAALRWT